MVGGFYSIQLHTLQCYCYLSQTVAGRAMNFKGEQVVGEFGSVPRTAVEL